MKNKNILIYIFILVALVQLILPHGMVSRESERLRKGSSLFQFKVRHLKQPNRQRGSMGSSIQGKYIWLQFEQASWPVKDRKEWENSQNVYVSVVSDSLGYGKISGISKEQPTGNDWIQARAFLNMDADLLMIQYPFSRYVVEDVKSGELDRAYTKKLKDSTSNIYLKVRIMKNEFLQEDLVIDSLTFREFARKVQSGVAR